MKEILSGLPSRKNKNKKTGLTMMMDKGLSLRQTEDFLEVNSDYVDIIKLGFGTSIITPNIIEKIKIYHKHNMMVYVGGTLFEAFLIRKQIEDFKTYLNRIGIHMVEISDGTININHDLKCKYISEFSTDFKIISEVGSKLQSKEISENQWIKHMKKEIQAGSWKVIAEGRESGNIGVFNNSGTIKHELINNIIKEVSISDIIWETPKKEQQAWFINTFGANVNLGNIAHDDIIPLECLRLGLRGDTFNKFIPN